MGPQYRRGDHAENSGDEAAVTEDRSFDDIQVMKRQNGVLPDAADCKSLSRFRKQFATENKEKYDSQF